MTEQSNWESVISVIDVQVATSVTHDARSGVANGNPYVADFARKISGLRGTKIFLVKAVSN
jgi:hypothetical protein